MKEINLNKKLKVIKLFLSGYTFDEIATELGIAKGSVTNIIDALRNGELQIALNEYIDALRELAVDLRKQHTTVKKLKMYVAIDQKLAEMGVGVEEVDDWLDIAHDIATEPATMKSFVSSALEMSQMEMETGLDCASLVAEYKNTWEALNNLKAEMANTIELKKKEDAELDATIQARKAAQEDLDDYMAQKQLSWDKVNTTIAILHGEFTRKGLDEKDIGGISKQIAEIGSLSAFFKAKTKENDALEEHFLGLKEDAQNLELASTGLQKHNDQLASEVYAMMEGKKVLDKQLEETKLQVGGLKTIKYHYAEDIYTGWVILAFLHNPEATNDYDFDRFAETINGVRMARLGEKPKQVVNAAGKVICQCQVSVPHTPLEDYGVAMDKVREKLAQCLMPLVSNKFIPKFEYEQVKLMNEIKEMYEKLSSSLSGHPEESYQPADQHGSSGEEMIPVEIEPNTNPHEAATAGEAISEQPEVPKVSLDYWSPEAIKARWKVDKEFGAKVGPRTCTTPYTWEGTNNPVV